MARKREIIVIHKPAEEHHGHHGGSWKVAYADFVTALMALFLLLWLLMALKPQQKQEIAKMFKPGEAAQGDVGEGSPVFGESAGKIMTKLDPKQRQQLELAGQLKALVKDEVRNMPGSGVTVDDRGGILLKLPSSILFAPGTSELTPEAQRILDGVATMLMKHKINLQVRGHTDDAEAKGTGYPSKWEFSAARAAAALKYITTKFTLPPVRYEAVGFGDSRPMAPNTSEENKKLNRRIEIYYSFNESQ